MFRHVSVHLSVHRGRGTYPGPAQGTYPPPSQVWWGSNPRYLPLPRPGPNRGGGTPRYLPPPKVPTPRPGPNGVPQGTYPPPKVPTPWPGPNGGGGTPRYLPPAQCTYPSRKVLTGDTPRYITPPKVPTPSARSQQGRGYPKVPTPIEGTYPLVRSQWGVPQGTYPLPAQGTYPLARSQWGRGYPKVPTPLPKVPTLPARSWWGVPQGTYPPPKIPTPSQVLTGGGGTPRYLPPSRSGRGVPQGTPPNHPAKDLLHGRRYTSCVHAGGLSCVIVIFFAKVVNCLPKFYNSRWLFYSGCENYMPFIFLHLTAVCIIKNIEVSYTTCTWGHWWLVCVFQMRTWREISLVPQ